MECRPSQIKDKADVKANPLRSFLTTNKKISNMAKEEVTLREKFTKWNVFRKVGDKVVESVETTPKPMTSDEAMKHFKVNVIQARID